ncbi:MAG: transcriptional regulator [Oceanicaulis sp. HLUCCA04]|nr:MAG: transcriptional regulator [Oceanicaulis sp. HLUCCA04]
MSNNHNARRGGSHARVYSAWRTLPAFRALSLTALRLLIHVLCEHRAGGPNIWRMDDQTAALLLDCSPNTGGAAIRELITKGWMRIERPGGMTGPRRARSRLVSLSQYPTAARPAESWRYENWMPSVHSNAPKNGAERTKK